MGIHNVARKLGDLGGFWCAPAVAVMLLANACALEPGSAEESSKSDEGPVAKTSSALTSVTCSASLYSLCLEAVDPSGTITVRHYTCNWSATQSAPFTSCPVESDFTLVSGGAEIEGLTASPGALLVGSWPTNNGAHVGNTWEAGSADHILPFPHRIRAHAVGLKLKGVAASSLYAASFFGTTESSTTLSHAPGAIATDPTFDHIIVGGGAFAISFNGQGQFLTASIPNGTDSWYAASKDHIVSDPGRVVADVIGIPRCPAGYAGGCLAATTSSRTESFVSTGYGFRNFVAPSGLAVAIGGQSLFQGAGRMLSSAYLLGNVGIFISKDHDVASSGNDIDYQITISKQ